MSTAHLHIDLTAIAENWRQLDALTSVETAAVVKADGYGLGVGRVVKALAEAGARRFFVAVAEEGAAVREALGPGPEISVFSGHMDGDTKLIDAHALTPMINSADQLLRHLEALPNRPFGIQLDTGMNRLGMEHAEWLALRDIALGQSPTLIMSHLACADEPDHPMNRYQLDTFLSMTEGLQIRRSLAATGGLLLGPAFHFDLCRPGIGLFGGMPFEEAQPVIELHLPVIQIRDLAPGETAGYGNAWTAERPTRLATVSAGYADGIHRAAGALREVFAEDIPCPIVGRVSMDLITVDVTDLPEDPPYLTLVGSAQGVDQLADAIGTIGYEVLTGLGRRYSRSYRA